MAISPVDRDTQYMKEHWGTTSLITDYTVNPKHILQEVMYDPANVDKSKKTELFETSEEDISYGVEPTYKIGPNQKFIRE